MFEQETYEVILARMKGRVADDLDKREGGIIHDALAPIALELAQAYDTMNILLELTFARTSNGEYLDLRLEESGVKRKEATKSIRRGIFNLDVPINARFRGGDVVYKAIEKIDGGIFKLEAETAGNIGNKYFGTLLPLENIVGLTMAELDEVLIPGEDREGDADYYARYLREVTAASYGGNVDQYEEWIGTIQGVGRVKIIPLWNGRGTIKAVITDSNNSVPTSELVSSVQIAIDPGQDGAGKGLAPVGHIFTAAAAVAKVVDFEILVKFKHGFGPADVEAEIKSLIDEYFGEINLADPERQTVVRRTIIISKIVQLSRVDDVLECWLNGVAANIILADDEIGLRGAVVINVSAD